MKVLWAYHWRAVILSGLFAFSANGLLALPAGNKVAPAPAIPENVRWIDIRTLPVEGQAWTNNKAAYDRLPARAESLVRSEVWNLSRQSAGLLVRFIADADAIYARWSLTSSNLAMPNMAAIGASGLDLYVRDRKEGWRWLGVGQPKGQTNTAALVTGMPFGQREYLLYLPLYNGVSSVEIGVASNATVQAAGPWGKGARKPIVFYGTSITQGASASRPGMCHVAMLGRHFNWPTINLGFSGQGRMESEMADIIADIDPAVFVLDCLPNMDAAGVRERVVPFVKKLRAAHPLTPIVLVEDRVYANAFLTPKRAGQHEANHAALKAAFEQLRAGGMKKIFYLPGADLLGTDGEGTVDGSHPNEIGFARQTDAFAKVLKPLLQPEN